MLNQVNVVFSCPRGGRSSVISILYTAVGARFGCQGNRRTRECRSGDRETVSNCSGWLREWAEFRRLTTDKRRKRSEFIERLVRLDKESYGRHAAVGARGEPIGN